MKKLHMFIGIAAAALLITGGAFAAKEGHDEKNEAASVQQVKITLDAAVSAALQAVPGKASRAELEHENNLPVYGIEIVKPDNQVVDVKVDADSGKVLKVGNDMNDRKGEKSENGHEDSD
jgi:uncharacterized membrane protein YkoI